MGGLSVTALETPCHTRGHICYYVEGPQSRAVFTGVCVCVCACVCVCTIYVCVYYVYCVCLYVTMYSWQVTHYLSVGVASFLKALQSKCIMLYVKYWPLYLQIQ